MNRTIITTLLLIASTGPTLAAEFERDVAPLLIRNCLGCHKPSEASGGLDLTTLATTLKGGETGPALKPKQPAESLLFRRIAEGSMPPKKHGPRLGPAAVASFKSWIEQGANWPKERTLSVFEMTTDKRAGLDWWSLQLLTVRAPAPGLGDQGAIDSFIRTKVRERKLVPAPEAHRSTLIRRAKFDLLGLPPTPAEVEAFLKDESPDAYERLIDRLLAAPHYGERWGRHWLDVVRYGESDGFENDRLREHAWRYRDYVVRSLNADKPYDQFVIEQLAGDALTPVTHEGIAATGFLVAGPWDEIQNVAVSKLEKQRAHEEQLEELLAAVSQTFLGMTVNCARCHDHKFDPIPQSDYYRLKAVFDGVDHGNRPLLTPAEQAAHDQAVAPIQKRVAELKSALAAKDHALDKLGAAFLTDGKFGKALDARKGHFVTQLKPGDQQPPLTVECWAKLENKGGFNILVASSLKESSEHWEIYSYAGSGEFSVYLPGYAPAEIKSGVDITDNRWHHLAMSFDGQRVRLFIDARVVKDVEVKRQRTGGAVGLLWIGAYPPQKIGCAGVVDEVRIRRGIHEFDRVPDAPQKNDGDTTGLWHLDEPSTGRSAGSEVKEQQVELKRLETELARRAPALVYAGVRRQPPVTNILLRGDIQKLGPMVTGQGLSCVKVPSPDLHLKLDDPEAHRRLKFAQWAAHPDNPLTARVLVNRVWQYHFGHGLIDTPSDLGFSGGKPTHPELLDWLAHDFVEHGWSIKHLQRRIMLSATYRQASRLDPQATAIDVDNRLLWRFSPRRLEAETVRDAMLAVSGELNPQFGGPSFRPFTITVRNHNFYHLVDKDAPEFNRRSLYRMCVNTGRSPFLDALDCPAPSLTTPKRRHTTTPLSALAMMNDPFTLRQAERFAQRVQREAGLQLDAQIHRAFQLALARAPTPAEFAAVTPLVTEHGLPQLCWLLVNTTEFVQLR